MLSLGGEGQNRTADTAIFSRVLCQLSYLASMAIFRSEGTYFVLFRLPKICRNPFGSERIKALRARDSGPPGVVLDIRQPYQSSTPIVSRA